MRPRRRSGGRLLKNNFKLEAFVSLQLIGQLQPRRPLDAIIEDMSKQAQKRGLMLQALYTTLYLDR